jgi:hypothetical protein
MGIYQSMGNISIYGDVAFSHKQKPYIFFFHVARFPKRARHVMFFFFQDSTNGDEHRLTKMPLTPLVMTNIAKWKDPPFLIGKPSISIYGPFSIAM